MPTKKPTGMNADRKTKKSIADIEKKKEKARKKFQDSPNKAMPAVRCPRCGEWTCVRNETARDEGAPAREQCQKCAEKS
jgi:predicted RNA-binding Zn-ribbon protein involved in translation (DUF1610 family)